MSSPSNASWLDLAQRLQESTGYRCLIHPGNIYFTDEYGDAALLGSLPPTTMPWIGFAGLDFPEPEVVTWRSFSAPFFPDFVQAAVPWSRENGYRYWTAAPSISAEMNGVLRGMGWSPLLRLDLERSTLVDSWLADHRDPFHDLFRKDMKESTLMKYSVLTEDERASILRQRLRDVEADYFRTSIQANGPMVGPGGEDVSAARLDDLEKTAGTLQTELAKLDAAIAKAAPAAPAGPQPA